MSSFLTEDTASIYDALLREEAAKVAAEKIHIITLQAQEQLQQEAVAASATIRRLQHENETLRAQLATVQQQKGETASC